MNYKIVTVTEAELLQIEQIEQQCFSCPWTVEQLRSQLHDAHHEFIAAVDESGTVLGYVGMMYVLDEGYISNVAVAPEFRRNGIADKLIEELMTMCKSLNLSFVTLEVRAGNEPAKSLYAKHGFVAVGTRKNYYDLPKEDAILMTHYF
jgi:ribosomal-protein-alanine N-acetyltransferase